ncbi:MAG: YqaA family protein [Alphaproteobacteria bacterium]
MTALAAYAGLFAASFLAATIFPFQSELVLVGLLLGGDLSWPVLLAVATAGNVLGSVVNWGLGRFLLHFRDRRWFPVKPESYARMERCFARWGVWLLLFAWLPVVGDPLTVVAGALRVNLALFVVLVTLGKLGRYAVLVAATLGWM